MKWQLPMYLWETWPSSFPFIKRKRDRATSRLSKGNTKRQFPLYSRETWHGNFPLVLRKHYIVTSSLSNIPYI
jgi:hypothetical protein